MKKKIAIWLCLVLALSMVFSPDMTEAKKKKIKLNKKKVTLYIGKKVRLKVKGTKKKVKWKSSKKKVATVSKKGVVKAKRKGTARITAKVGKKKLVCKVKVKKKKKPTKKPTKKPVVLTKKPVQSGKPTTEKPTTEEPATGKPGTPATPTPTPDGSGKPVTPATPTPSASAVVPSGPAPAPFVPTITKEASFENGTDGFTARGAATVSSANGGHSGKCLYVSGRSDKWHGAGYEAGGEMVPGATYQIDAYVKLASGTGTVKCTYQDDNNSYNEITTLTATTSWTKISKEFTVPDSFSMFYIYFEMPNDKTASFYLDDITLTRKTAGQEVQLTSIKDTYDSTFGKMGTCINLFQLESATTLAYVKEHYSSFTLENEMKPEAIMKNDLVDTATAKTQTGSYQIPSSYTESKVPSLNYSTIDKVLKIAKANGLKMRAHTLVWHSQTPPWFFKVGYKDSGDYVSTTVMDARMEMFIRSVMHHVYTLDGGAYKDVVYAWDVANEYLNNDENKNWSAVYGNRSGNLETNPPYLKKAFEVAYDMLEKFQLTDSVDLFYNDFNTYVDGHPDSVISLINYINQGESAKICKGIGMQSHLDVDYPSADLYVNTVKKFAEAGLEIQITELDVTINNDYGDYNDENETDEDQAKYVGDLMKKLIAVQNSTHAITGLTWWGLCDAVSWRGGRSSSGGNSHPLLFDTSIYDVKPSYYSFIQAIQS